MKCNSVFYYSIVVILFELILRALARRYKLSMGADSEGMLHTETAPLHTPELTCESLTIV